MVQAVEVERLNLPGSKYLERFAAVRHEVVTKYAPVESAERLNARIARCWKNDEGVYISVDTWSGTRWWTDAGTYGMAVPLSDEERRALLKYDDSVQMLVWNRVVVDIELPSLSPPRQVSSASRWKGASR